MTRLEKILEILGHITFCGHISPRLEYEYIKTRKK